MLFSDDRCRPHLNKSITQPPVLFNNLSEFPQKLLDNGDFVLTSRWSPPQPPALNRSLFLLPLEKWLNTFAGVPLDWDIYIDPYTNDS
jgi:hypothetical protein